LKVCSVHMMRPQIIFWKKASDLIKRNKYKKNGISGR
jgi:hypothetical protein